MEQNTEKGQKRLKGTVLFTVVSVMMVMVVFLMSTLILATASHKRAYYTYYEKQAQYAAQAALDAVTNSAYTDKDFFTWVDQNVTTPGVTQPITVDFGSANLNITDGLNNQVTCTIEALDPSPIWDQDTGKLYLQKRWKITATAHVGNGSNEREESVSNYLYASPNKVLSASQASTQNKGESAFVSGVTENKTENPGAGGNNGTNGGSTLHALTSHGVGSGWANMIYLGPGYSDWDKFPHPGPQITYSDSPTQMNLQGDSVGDFFFNGSLSLGTQRQFEFHRNKEQVIIYGNLELGMNVSFVSNIPDTASLKPTKYNELDLVYVDGKLTPKSDVQFGAPLNASGQGGWKWGETNALDANGQPIKDYSQVNQWNDGSIKQPAYMDTGKNGEGGYPVNVVAGSIDTVSNNAGLHLYGDMYLFNSKAQSAVSEAKSTRLSRFVEGNITKTTVGTKTVTGNLISDNETLTVNGMNMGGDLIFANPTGTLVLNGMNDNIKIDGALVCDGTLSIPNNCNIRVSGGLYVDPTKVSVPSGATVNGKTLSQASVASDLALINSRDEGGGLYSWQLREYQSNEAGNRASILISTDKHYYDAEGNEILNSATSAQINALNMTAPATGANYADTFRNLRNYAFDGYKDYEKDRANAHVFYPYIGRNDEIFAQYVRWDLQQPESFAKPTDDAMINESEAAGHTWDVKEFNNAKGEKVYAPCTTPKVSANIMVDTGKTNFESVKLTKPQDYIDDPSEITGLSSFPVISKDDPSSIVGRMQNVRIAGHDSDGNLKTNAVLENAIVIDESVKIDTGSFSTGNMEVGGPGSNQWMDIQKYTFFVDPTPGHQIVIDFEGENFPINNYVTFVVNNTVNYQGNYSEIIDSNLYENNGTIFQRDDCLMFFETGAQIPALRVLTTGSYYQALGDAGINQNNVHGHLNIVSNPLYPGDPNFENVPLDRRYAYQLVPNIRICAQNGSNIYAEKTWMLNAEVIMPTANIKFGSMEFMSEVSYREDWDSNENLTNLMGGGDVRLLVWGSITADNIDANLPEGVFAYIGDGNRPGTTPGTPSYGFGNTVDGGNNESGNEQNLGDQGYFQNEYQGAG